MPENQNRKSFSPSDLTNMASLGIGHWFQIISSIGCTAGVASMTTYFVTKWGMSADTAGLLALAIIGFFAAVFWAAKERLKFWRQPPPGAAIVPATPKALDALDNAGVSYVASDAQNTYSVVSGVAVPMRRVAPLLALLLLVAGCATSEQFKAGIRAAAPLVADEATAYTKADPVLTTFTRGQQDAQAAALRDTAASDCGYTDVKLAWDRLRPWYVRYVEQDRRLTDAVRPLILNTAKKIDELIAAEGNRRRLLFLPQ